MKKLYVLLFTLFLVACEKQSKDAQTLTPQQETVLVDSIAQDLSDFTEDLNQKADSVTADVDSLLQGI
jgi:hypothetical protein